MDWHLRSFNAATLEVAGFQLEEAEHEQFYKGLPTLKKIDMLIQRGRLSANCRTDIVQAKLNHFKRIVADNLYPDVQKIALVKQVHCESIYTACVTNCNQMNADLLLRAVGLMDLLDFVVNSDMVVAGKPSPEGYYKAMLHFGVKPEETLIVEDSPVGIAAASASGANVLTVLDPTEMTWAKLQPHL